MQHGSTVIFSNEYIEELTRHRDIAQRKYDVENMPNQKAKLKEELEAWENKLAWAEEFQDTIDSFVNVEVPKITAIKTMGGYEYPAKYLQVI